MLNFEKITWFFPKSIISRTITDNSIERRKFLNDLDLLNTNRIKSFLFFINALVIAYIIIDLSDINIWKPGAKRFYFVVDSVYFFLLIILSLIIWFKVFKSVRFIAIIAMLTLFFSLTWTAMISVYEVQSGKGNPTFIIGAFFICTLFLHRKLFIIISLAWALFIFITGLYHFNHPREEILEILIPTIVMLILAYIVSRVLFKSHIVAFHASWQQKRTNLHLDELVKMRTEELFESNDQLKTEIREREKYEKQLRKEIKRAEEADRLKSAFLANMSHEIRTPLNGIIGFSDLLNMQQLAEEKRQRYATIVRSNSQQLLQIIDDIIDISMIESNQLKFNYHMVNLFQIFRGVSEFYKNLFEREHITDIIFTSEYLLKDKELTLFTDPNRLQQVIYNLIGNALKFTKKGEIRFCVRKDDNHLFFYVEDTGIGISDEKASIIFERFRQAEDTLERSYSGTGLGLSISKGIINQMKGNIWFDSFYKDGARFCFSVPLFNDVCELEKYSSINPEEINKLLKNKNSVLFSYEKDFTDYIKQNILKTKSLTKKQFNPKEFINNSKHDICIFHLNEYKSELEDLKNNPNIILVFNDVKELDKAKKAGLQNTYSLPLNNLVLVKNIQQILS
ncbi:MAG: hypothetical protein JXA77_11100 [Bacteroidales bacterium]|nr:hypothetical protein [Bacteroidales bacterium]MBN2819039.1 hypothetical protein [Bacteroidales bacterium]